MAIHSNFPCKKKKSKCYSFKKITYEFEEPIQFTYLVEFEPVGGSRVEGSGVQHSKSTLINAYTEKSASPNALSHYMNQKQFI